MGNVIWRRYLIEHPFVWIPFMIVLNSPYKASWISLYSFQPVQNDRFVIIVELFN